MQLPSVFPSQSSYNHPSRLLSSLKNKKVAYQKNSLYFRKLNFLAWIWKNSSVLSKKSFSYIFSQEIFSDNFSKETFSHISGNETLHFFSLNSQNSSQKKVFRFYPGKVTSLKPLFTFRDIELCHFQLKLSK